MRPNINQVKLIDQINIYRHTHGASPLSTKGLCRGFAIVHAYMAATDKLEWWYAALEQLASWDGRKESLDTKIELPNADPDEKNKTLGYLLERVISYAVYNQAGSDAEVIDNINQTDFLNIDNAIFSENEPITKKTDAAGCMHKQTLETLLIPDFFAQKNAVFLIQSLNHTCTIRFDSQSSTWRFYDPNYDSREKSFEKVDDLIHEIHTRIGRSLHMTAASWDSRFKTDIFEDQVKKLTDQSTVKLLHDHGLLLIAQCAPNQLADILALAEKHEYIRPSLAYALTMQNKKGWTALHKIACHAPDQLTKIIQLAEVHSSIREAFAEALKAQNKDGWTALHIIARHAPDQLAGIMALAEKHNDVLFSVVAALKAKNNEGITGLKAITTHSKKDVAGYQKLIKLVENIGEIKLEQMSKLINELDIYIAKKTPKQSGAGGNTVKKTGAEKLKQYLLDVRTGKKDLDSALIDIQSDLENESNKKSIFKKWSANLNPNNFFAKTGIIKREGHLERFYLRAQSVLSTAATPSQKLTR